MNVHLKQMIVQQTQHVQIMQEVLSVPVMMGLREMREKGEQDVVI